MIKTQRKKLVFHHHHRGVNHSLDIPIRNQESRTSKPEILLKNEKSRTLNVEVIYPSAN